MVSVDNERLGAEIEDLEPVFEKKDKVAIVPESVQEDGGGEFGAW